MENCSCGCPIEPGARFCRDCGSALGTVQKDPFPDGLGVSGSKISEPGSEPLLLESSSGSRSGKPVSQAVAKRGTPFGLWLLGAAALVAIGWLIFGAPEQESPSPADDHATASQDDGSQPSNETLNRDSSGTLNGSSDRDVDVDGNDDPGVESSEIGELEATVNFEGPVLSEPSGLGLIYSLPGKQPVVLNLDTGETVKVSRVDAVPVTAIDQTVLFKAPGWPGTDGLYEVIDISDLEREPAILEVAGVDEMTFLGGSKSLLFVASSVEENPSIGGRSFIEFSLRGEAMNQASLPSGGIAVPGGWATSSDHGIYAMERGGFRRVFSGSVESIGENVAMVNRCSQTLECSVDWYRTDTWERLENPVPKLSGGPVVWSRKIVGDRWLVSSLDYVEVPGSINDGLAIYDINSGEEVRRTDPIDRSTSPSEDQPAPPYGLSQSGRHLYLDIVGETGTVLVDLESGEEFPIDLPPQASRFVLINLG